MGNFTQSVKKEFEFDGDKITIEVKRIKRCDMMAVAPFMPKSEGEAQTQEQSLATIDALSSCLPSYVTKFEGLTDADGESMALEDIIDEAYFSEFVSIVCGWWFEASQMQKHEVGKSKKRRQGGSGG